MFRRGWVTLSANFRRKRAPPTNHCWCQKTRAILFRAVSNYLQCIVWFCHKARVWQTDRRTDGQTKLPQLTPRKHSCWRGKNCENTGHWVPNGRNVVSLVTHCQVWCMSAVCLERHRSVSFCNLFRCLSWIINRHRRRSVRLNEIYYASNYITDVRIVTAVATGACRLWSRSRQPQPIVHWYVYD